MTDFGAELRRRRQRVGWSQPQLARAVFVTQSFVSKVETGAEVASPEFARACDEALNAGGALTVLVRARPPASLAEEVEAWELVDLLTASRLSAAAIQQMRFSADTYTARYPQCGARELFPVVQKQLRRLREALRHPMSLDAHREAVRLLAALSGLAGNLSLDLARAPAAAEFFAAARLAGEQVDDRDTVAWALATGSLAPYYAGDVRAALVLLDEAVDVADRGSSARRRAWTRALRARASAAAGDGDAARRDLGDAAEVLSGAEAPQPSDFFDQARLDGLAGATSLLLRDVEDAEDLLQRSLGARALGDLKGRALLMCDVAACRLVAGDAEAASQLLDQALNLDPSVVVSPLLTRARQVVADMMATHPPAARQWGDRLALMAAPA